MVWMNEHGQICKFFRCPCFLYLKQMLHKVITQWENDVHDSSTTNQSRASRFLLGIINNHWRFSPEKMLAVLLGSKRDYAKDVAVVVGCCRQENALCCQEIV